jgi:superfamily II DNA or RNA helicase
MTFILESQGITAKPHQSDAAQATLDFYQAGNHSQLIVLPTGAGKTITAGLLALNFEKTLFLVHTKKLLDQAVEAFGRFGEFGQIGVIQSKRWSMKRVTVATLQSITPRLSQIPFEEFQLVVVDECHHMGSAEWTKPIQYLKPKLLVGLSATPQREDGANLGLYFQKIAYQMSIDDAIQKNILTPPKALMVKTKVNLDSVRHRGHDFDEKDLDRAINTPARNQLVVDTIKQHPSRRIVGFTAGIAHAQALAELCKQQGIKATWVSGSDNDSWGKLDRYRAGEYQCIFNAALLTEGWDDPETDGAFIIRPVRSQGLLTQMIGRALRKHSKKNDALIVHFHDQSQTHLTTIWDIFGFERQERYGVVETITAPKPRIPKEEAGKNFKWLFASDLKLEHYIEVMDILKPPPLVAMRDLGKYAWGSDPATAKQLELLGKHGYDTTGEVWTKRSAAELIGSLGGTEKQLRLLLALGYDTLGHTWTREQVAEALRNADTSKVDWSLVNQIRHGRAKPAI